MYALELYAISSRTANGAVAPWSATGVADRSTMQKPAAVSDNNVWSACWFSWVTPLMRHGSQAQLQAEDLLELDPSLQPSACGMELWRSWTKELLLRPRHPSLLAALARTYGGAYAWLGLIKLLNDLLSFSGPLLLRLLLGPASPRFGLVCVALLAAASVLRALLNAHFNYQLIGLALYLLYTQVRYAFLAGLVVSLLLVPANRLIAGAILAASQRMMRAKDVRVSVVSELLRAIRQVKAAPVWQEYFVARVSAARRDELRGLAVRKYLDALCVYFWAATSLLFSALTFALVVALGGGAALTPAVAFTSLALFGLLTGPLNAFPWVVWWRRCPPCTTSRSTATTPVHHPYTTVTPATSLDSATEQALLQPLRQPLLQPREQPPPPQPQFGRTSVRASRRSSDSVFSVIPEGTEPAAATAGSSNATTPAAADLLAGAVFDDRYPAAPPGSDQDPAELEHHVGDGLEGMFRIQPDEGDEQLAAAHVAVLNRATFGLAPTAWVVPGATVRRNVLLGAPMLPGLYRKVLHACCLLPDLAAMPAGDLTRLGDNGSK
eukprot:XP_001689837.1 predicted protein [Chlamydomonas reinhardtii]